ncbi:hypothetical protein COW99_05830 [Candidatus Roizmanbacteria bacterium CG22_combo_CG10-13_8_21_14_all_38_20]|uniref:Ribbon-helix-helix protein CopG domain-containing protein n=1 Tax=Candidatus Roizmanbacteria bacterium CG22_combo_CG10-13_8_21_14_all_38_20 TaxID=1974862 RepID=A0A2H0BTV9_9BACT|nr:MAG: hypothetical protein COW99_05830 [Candidatus Roizmanbacteria bacterium CG22_combo_CG10-13_8_21_14_all_38_20]PJC32215.1 MAG: hypothetical protein CO050_00550 [Candidatus Roizmanbacteria bacterium CG_4_9_14_0_2_um_filter_38_17]
MTTVNISLPVEMYSDAKTVILERGYASLSELVRDALRGLLYPHLTVNGFIREFEDRVLEAATESQGKDVLLKTNKDLKNYFLQDKLPQKSNL